MSEILSLKQLNHAAKCGNKEDCHGCLLFETEETCIMAITLTALTFREMLKKHVWHKRSSDGKEFCIECRNLRENGHTKSCELAAMLKEG